ncbi:MAG: DUF4260 domain-containing protein [Methylovirgula sp.]
MSVEIPGAVVGAPKLFLRLEGLAIAVAAVFFYERFGGSWALFAVLILAPDLTFLAYLLSPRAGATAYNAAHTTLGPLAVLAAAAWLGFPLGEHIALIFLTHVGFDRALAYGLKYPSAFGDTHLGRIGDDCGA